MSVQKRFHLRSSVIVRKNVITVLKNVSAKKTDPIKGTKYPFRCGPGRPRYGYLECIFQLKAENYFFPRLYNHNVTENACSWSTSASGGTNRSPPYQQ